MGDGIPRQLLHERVHRGGNHQLNKKDHDYDDGNAGDDGDAGDDDDAGDDEDGDNVGDDEDGDDVGVDEDGDDVGEDDYKRVHRGGNYQLLRATMIMAMMTDIFF